MKTCRAVAPLFAALLLTTIPHGASAQEAVPSTPQALPLPPPIPPARDIPFPGTVELAIDARDVTRGVYRVTQTFPVPPGERELVLLLPQWLPGKHAPRGAIKLLADLRFTVDGEAASWTRDPVNVFAFHVPLPEGAREVTATFVHTSPVQSNEGRITMTREMLNLQWDAMSLYPAGYYVRRIEVDPTVTVPEGWDVFTALDGQSRSGNRVSWATVDYQTLVDSPIFAGENARSWDLGHEVELHAVADAPRLLDLAPEHLETYRKLVDEALALFGDPPFDHYEFLLALSDRLGGIGLEHQRSSENSYEPETFVEWDDMAWDRNVIAHEFMHAWNGKYHRPAGLWTPDYRQPMRDSLLWVYEGQTQFWGWVLAARSGVQPKDIVLGALANSAGYYSVQPGRAWRSVEDTTYDPIIAARQPLPYSSLSRSEEYYSEGMLVWLEADQVIREGTGGRKGLDDFARAFFSARWPGDPGQVTYRFDDVVAALDRVYPYDWAGFLTSRLRAPAAPAPLAGIEKAGYRLVWKDEPNPYEKGRRSDGGSLNLFYSLGVNLNSSGEVTSTMWDGPAFDAGLVDGAQIVAVNGEEYSADLIKRAIAAAKDGDAPIELLVKRGERYLTVPVEYHGGLRYPWLEKVGEGETGLDRLLTARTG